VDDAAEADPAGAVEAARCLTAWPALAFSSRCGDDWSSYRESGDSPRSSVKSGLIGDTKPLQEFTPMIRAAA
jgi:hypothetical protein